MESLSLINHRPFFHLLMDLLYGYRSNSFSKRDDAKCIYDHTYK